MKAAVVGGGVIGAGWAGRLVENGVDVKVFDPHPEAERRLQEVLDERRARVGAAHDGPPRPRRRAPSCPRSRRPSTTRT